MQQKIDDVAAEIRREYFRKWRAANKDKVRQHNENYWRRRAEKQLRQEREQKEENTDGE